MAAGKRILVTGATGFVGRALMLRLARDGHRLAALVRDVGRAREVLGEGVELVAAGDAAALARAVADADAIVNLAGEPIADRRWSRARKAALVESRVGVARALAAAAAGRASPLPVLVSASAVGIYRDTDEEQGEDAPPDTGFAAELCVAWEAAAREVPAARTAILRIGIVLGPEGGMVGKLAPLMRAHVAGRLGSGRQWVPWIHLVDLVEMLVAAIEDERWRGVFNATAPEPATNAALVAALAGALGGGAPLPVPAFALRAVLGERARLMLDGRRCPPRRARQLGFTFAYPTLPAAVATLAEDRNAIAIAPVEPAEVPPTPYLEARRPTHVLESEIELAAPLADVFAFFADAGNLELLTPPGLGFRIVSPRPIEMKRGATIDYALSINRVPVAWRTEIEWWEPGVGFVDTQLRGPYRAWWHEHRFIAHGDRTLMVDRVYYAAPLGPLGRLANALFVRATLERIFGFRRHAIALRFG